MRKLAAIGLLVLLAGCQNAPRYTIQPPPAPQQEQMAAATTTTTPPKPARPIPNYAGTAGPLKPAGIGRYMDGMEKDLRRILHGIPVARPGDLLALNLQNDLLFEKNGVLGEDGRDLLKALAAALRHYDRTLVQVNGYTDTRGAPDKSLKTSQKRADAVAAELRADGVDQRRLTATGFGQTHLKVATGADKAEARNRRIEIRILPHPG